MLLYLTTFLQNFFIYKSTLGFVGKEEKLKAHRAKLDIGNVLNHLLASTQLSDKLPSPLFGYILCVG